MGNGRKDSQRTTGRGLRRRPTVLSCIAPRLLGLLCLVTVVMLPLDASRTSAEPKKDTALEREVVEKMSQQEGAVSSMGFSALENSKETQVNVKRKNGDGTWAFGSAVIAAPPKKDMHPLGWLFVAEETKEGWDVALEGTSAFTDLVKEAPGQVVTEGEKKTFTTSGTGGRPIRTALRLPWKKAAKWRMTSGPHGWATGYDRPYSALDLAGGRQRVRAAGGGRVYTMCSNNRGWIRVYHRNGYATDYYHLRRNIKPRDGRRIKRGTFLGYTGTDTSCGGAAYGRHVHFALLKRGKHIALDNRTIGGWTFQQGRSYKGYARRGGVKRHAGDRIRNFGP